MKNRMLLALFCLFVSASPLRACDCFGNNSYCETLSPTWFVNPSTTVLAVKLDDHYYGIHVKVVQVIGGEALSADTLLVWGDNGALCRIYLNGFATGDTVVFGLNHCDLWGNTITAGFPPDLEQPGDYQVSVCGIYWLNYVNGNVQGQITAPVFQNMTLAEFTAAVQSCSVANTVEEVAARGALVVRYTDGRPVLEMTGEHAGMEMLITDAQGRQVVRCAWNGQPWMFTSAATGLYTARVSSNTRRWTGRILVD